MVLKTKNTIWLFQERFVNMLPPQRCHIYCSIYLPHPSPTYLSSRLASLFPSGLCINGPCPWGRPMENSNFTHPPPYLGSSICLPGTFYKLTHEYACHSNLSNRKFNCFVCCCIPGTL